ncbi:response regulator transcription factor [Konateibacter massiliensis]|uniref:response regulator transcription factor n=1 Tax=Konateibacter massiliensis TaxID=2002841 RepID=UPI000C156938|nr:response regulator [Konateibacter massiliensis]
MLKVLIVDDEESICNLIHYLVPWKELDMQVVCMLHNGGEAIEVLKEQRIDILISDARMPGCDGIELIKWCRDNQPRLKCIIISGFRHFEYAHGAMKYGAVDYLLKPIKKDELVETLQQISNGIRQEKDVEEDKLVMQKVIDLNKDNLKRHFINSYIFGNSMTSNEDIAETDINEQYKLNFQKGVYQTIFFKLDDVSKAHKELEQLMLRMEEKIDAEMKAFCSEYAGTRTHTGIIYLVNYPVEKTTCFLTFIQGLYESLEKQVDLFEYLRLTIGIGAKQTDIKYIRECMQTAGSAVKYRIVNEEEHILEYEKYQYKEVDISTVLTREIEEIIKNCLKTGNKDGLHRCILKTKSDIAKIQNCSPLLLYDYAAQFGMWLKGNMEEITDSEEEKRQAYIKYNEEIDHAISAEDIWRAAEGFAEYSIDYVAHAMKNTTVKPLRLAMEYIAEHYREPITLELVAEAVMLSPNYLSKMFKNETGTNFSEYLVSKRIEKASELLRNTDKAIANIAEEVGYADLKYFRKLCKKYMGLKPSEYRKLYS